MCECMCGWVCVLCVCVSECVCVCLLYECACLISVRACMIVCVCLSEIFPCSVFVFSLIHGSVLCVCRFDWHIWRSTVFYQKIFLFFDKKSENCKSDGTKVKFYYNESVLLYNGSQIIDWLISKFCWCCFVQTESWLAVSTISAQVWN